LVPVKGDGSMNASENIKRLRNRLERNKSDLWQDAWRIRTSVRSARAAVSPRRLIKQRPLMIVAFAFALGFALGDRGIFLEEVVRPAARLILSTAATQAASSAFRGMI
jgi:hypothetical protein